MSLTWKINNKDSKQIPEGPQRLLAATRNLKTLMGTYRNLLQIQENSISFFFLTVHN